MIGATMMTNEPCAPSALRTAIFAFVDVSQISTQRNTAKTLKDSAHVRPLVHRIPARHPPVALQARRLLRDRLVALVHVLALMYVFDLPKTLAHEHGFVAVQDITSEKSSSLW